jgi:hypothetical protein
MSRALSGNPENRRRVKTNNFTGVAFFVWQMGEQITRAVQILRYLGKAKGRPIRMDVFKVLVFIILASGFFALFRFQKCNRMSQTRNGDVSSQITCGAVAEEE